MRSKTRHTKTGLICTMVAGILASTAFAQGNATYQLDIKPQPLAEALKTFAQQSGLQVVFYTEEASGYQAQAIKGRLTRDEALRELLRGTALTYHDLNANTVEVAAAKAEEGFRTSANGHEGYPMRLAQLQASDADAGGGAHAAAEPDSPTEVVVTAAPYRFLDADTRGTTNLPLPIESVPQSITMLSADFMQAAGIRQSRDFDRYIAGVSSAGDQGGFRSTERLRGFDTGPFFSRYVDGLLAGGLNYPEFTFFERVELVKGPASVTYGIAPPGGLYNFVSKRASKVQSARVAGEVGSWNSYRAEAEVGGPINSEGSLRAVGMAMYDAGDSFIHDFDHKDSGVYGGLEYGNQGRFSGGVNVRYSDRSNSVTDGYLFYQDGSRPDISRGFFQGDPQRNRLDATYGMVNGHLDFAVTDAFEVGLKANYQDIDRDHYYAYAYGLQDDGSYTMDGGTTAQEWDSYATALNGLYRFRIRGIDGSFVSASATYMHVAIDSKSRPIDYHGDENTVVNLSEGESGLHTKLAQWTVADVAPFRFHNETNVKLLSLQSLFKVTERLAVLAGGSLSDPMQRRGTPGARTTTNFDQQVSLRGGLMYEFRQKSNVYLSYSDSFEPQNVVKANQELLPPLEGSQWELGVKSRQFNGMLLLTAAAFRLEQKNAPAFDGFDPVYGDYYRAQGEVRHQGVELEAMGLVTPSLTISAAATYLDPKIVADEDASLAGKQRLFRPRQAASVFMVKNFEGGALQGFNVGGGVRYIGSQKTSYDGSSRDLSAYTVVDLIAGYKAERWSAQLSLNNVFDKFYVQGNNYDTYFYGNTLGESFNARLRVTWNFGGAGR